MVRMTILSRKRRRSWEREGGRPRRDLRFERFESRRLLAGHVPTPSSLDSPVVDALPEEQLLVELINRARADPSTESARLGVGLNDGLEEDDVLDGTPSPPLALRQPLFDAARDHSLAMIDRDFFSHVDPRDGSSPSDRARAANYPGGAGENLAFLWFNPCESRPAIAEEAHELLFGSPGHRVNLLRPSYRDVGVGIALGDAECTVPRFEQVKVTEKFGFALPAALTGVAFVDNVVQDDFYSVGEGLDGVVIEARSSSGEMFRTMTGPSGGYTLDLPPAAYVVTASGAGLESSVVERSVVIDRDNVKLDFRPVVEPESEEVAWRHLDVNDDGRVTALDALLVINRIARQHRGSEIEDPDGTDWTALHALRIINFVARQAAGDAPDGSGAEGEHVGMSATDDAFSLSNDWRPVRHDGFGLTF